MSIDNDFDFSFSPSGICYPARTVMLDSTTVKACFMGGQNAMCVGVTPQQSEFAAGMIGNNSFPYILAQPNEPNLPPGSQSRVPAYGPGRKTLLDIDPAYAGQIKPNDLVISSNSGYGTKASPFGPWNQWIIGIALAFANGGQSCNILVWIFPWS